jgi:outer membrane protein assembly factor BamB
LGVTPSAVGPPTTSLTLYYSGFSAREAVDLYFDTSDFGLGLTSSNGAGNFAVTIPADAHPGSHWITAVGRRSGFPAQIAFTVRTSWPQFGFTPNHKAKNLYENVLSTATVANLDEAWRTPEIDQIQSTPAVVNGIVYSGFGDGTIRAFDETTGAPKWTYTTGGGTGYSSPAVSNGIVYVGSFDAYLYALDAVTGALKWRYQTGSQILSSPNVVSGIVYFGSYDDKIYALNATTGALVWSYTTNGLVFSSPMVANGVLYVGSYDNKLYALNAATGALIWAFTAGNLVESSPVLAGGLICFGCADGMMYALHPSGAEAWTYSAGAAVDGSAAAVGGAIFFGNSNGAVYSLSSSGALRWTAQLQTGVFSPVSTANGVVYVKDQYYTYALDQNTGATLTTLPAGSFSGGAAVVDGAVFAGNVVDNVLIRYTPNALLSNYVAPRPDPMQLRPHKLR